MARFFPELKSQKPKGMVANFLILEWLDKNMLQPKIVFHFCWQNLKRAEFYMAFHWQFSMIHPNTKSSKCISKTIFLGPGGTWTQDHWVTAKYANQTSNHNLLVWSLKCCFDKLINTYTLFLMHTVQQLMDLLGSKLVQSSDQKSFGFSKKKSWFSAMQWRKIFSKPQKSSLP